MEAMQGQHLGATGAGAGERTGIQKLSWIQRAEAAPYFVDEEGRNWTPIGQNDAITWPDLQGLFRRKNLKAAEDYLLYLKAHGVTCLRLMLEYCQTENRYLERPVGRFQPNMVKLWDDLFFLCEKHGLRILLTPFDTFWMWLRWKKHPYNKVLGGPCARRNQWLLCPDTLEAIKGRLTFATRRWGGSGVLFAWDLWNEIHPAHANNSTDTFYHFITQISTHLRQVEISLYGRTHLQTISLFGPVLQEHPAVADVIFRHPGLDFATTHFYDTKTINHPKDTVASALCTGRLVREALEHLAINRPFFDSEHGPIHAFKDKRCTLPQPFDDEYFRHIQWAHLASGAAGGGMRWPYRRPHVLTESMRQAQQNLSQFIAFINWSTFQRRNLNQEVKLSTKVFAVFACADARQAIVWLLRQDQLDKKGMIRVDAEHLPVTILIPYMQPGDYQVYFWNTVSGVVGGARIEKLGEGEMMIETPSISSDLALAIVRI